MIIIMGIGSLGKGSLPRLTGATKAHEGPLGATRGLFGTTGAY